MSRCYCEGEANALANESTAEGDARRPPLRSYLGVAGWLVPGTILALLPKCPACLAAHVALGTGFALSASAAESLRSMLVALCVGSLSYAAFRRTRRVLSRRRQI